MNEFGPTQYAKRSGHHLAYRVRDGQGRPVLTQMGGFIPMSAADGPARAWVEPLASYGHTVLFDRWGVGESDPIDPSQPPTLDDAADDAVAVLDAVGIDRAAFIGGYDAGPVGIRVATRHPERIDALVLAHAFVCWATAHRQDFSEQYEAIVESGPQGDVDPVALAAPSAAGDEDFRHWLDDAGRRGASPATAVAITTAQQGWDVRGELGDVRCPTLVVHRTGNLFVTVEEARLAAERIPDAHLIEVPGVDHIPWVGDVDSLLDPIEEFLTGRRAGVIERALAAVLFTDIVDSTRRAADTGDRGWKQTLTEHDDVAVRSVVAHGGELIKSTGDGVLAVFPTPGAAIHAAAGIRDRVRRLDLEIRAGIHVGEIERIGDDIAGMAVNIAARVMDQADAGEVLVSGAVPPLMAGSGTDFDDRGSHGLKGVPGDWQLLIARV